LSSHVEYWQIYVGVVLLAVVMLAPRGISSLLRMGKSSQSLEQGESHGA